MSEYIQSPHTQNPEGTNMSIPTFFRNPPTLPVAYAWWDYLPKFVAIFVTTVFVFESTPFLKDASVLVLLVTFYGILFWRAYSSKSRIEDLKSLFLTLIIMSGTIFLLGASTGDDIKNTLIAIFAIALHLSATMLILVNLIQTFRAPKPDKPAPLWIRVTGSMLIICIGVPLILRAHGVI